MSNDFSLLETILYIPSAGFYLLDYHLARLQNAIQDFRTLDQHLFQNAPTNQDITDELKKRVPQDDKYHRVRLLVDTQDKITVEHTLLPKPEYAHESLDEAAKMTPKLTVVLDTEPFSLSNNDPYILHKTTKRDMYNIARARTSCQWHGDNNEPFDVIMYNSNNEITETSITNIAIRFIIDGKPVWKTPKVTCGLLPGVFRSFLLDQMSDLVEDVITIDELKRAQKEGYPIVCFNSVRMAYRVKLLTV